MPPTTSSYTDVIPILDAALRSERGIRYRLPTWGKALNFRQRCYRFRARYREEEKQRLGNIPGIIPRSPYDSLFIQIESPAGENYTQSCPEELKASPFDVVIKEMVPDGQLLDEDGNPIELHAEHQIDNLGLDTE
jgi:hypothetical protein